MQSNQRPLRRRMSKKLVNDPERAVDEALAGLVAVHPGLVLLEGHRVVLRADISRVISDNKVTLLSGGGSGHEPAHAGFVGRGMLSAAVAGSVFASPPPGSILAAVRAISSPAGTLMVVKNYTGDRLNFGIAAERAKTEGMKVEMVIVGEDTALPSLGKSAGRRGLCGTVLVHKVAGALAENGCSLEQVAAAAQKVAESIATMSVSLSPCSLPGKKPSFQLTEDEMELGLGIHGEAGAQRTKLQPADQVVQRMLDHLTSQEPGYQYFVPKPGMEVALVVNNLGGTSNLELSIVANAAITYLRDRCQLNIVRAYMGAFMTSLEMAGISLTVLKMESQWAQCLDLATTAPGWPTTSIGPDGSAIRLDSTAISCPDDSSLVETTINPQTEMGRRMKMCAEKVCSAFVAAEEELNELDRGSGDGDCGSTFKSGADALIQCISKLPWDEPQQALLHVAQTVEKSMGGTSGAIYTLFLTSAAAVMTGPTLDSVVWLTSLEAGMDAVMRYGGACPGDRTMLDALHPAITVFRTTLGQRTDYQAGLDALSEAVQAAKAGAAATVSMEARAGRASYVHSSQLKQPDPGAQAVTVWLKAIHSAFY